MTDSVSSTTTPVTPPPEEIRTFIHCSTVFHPYYRNAAGVPEYFAPDSQTRVLEGLYNSQGSPVSDLSGVFDRYSESQLISQESSIHRTRFQITPDRESDERYNTLLCLITETRYRFREALQGNDASAAE